MLILSPLDPISSVVSAGHTLGLRGGSDSDLSRRITILDAQLGGFSQWQKSRMLIIPREDAIAHALALQQLFLASQFAVFLVPGIGAKPFSGKALTVFLVNATCH